MKNPDEINVDDQDDIGSRSFRINKKMKIM